MSFRCRWTSRWLTALFLLLFSLPLLAQVKGPAFVKVPLAPVYLSPSTQSEQVTQALLWDLVEVKEVAEGWCSVIVRDQFRTQQGYPGWIRSKSLAQRPAPTNLRRVVVAYPSISVRAEPNLKAPILTSALLSTRLPLKSDKPYDSAAPETSMVDDELWYQVLLPDGLGWVRARQVRVESSAIGGNGTAVVDDARKFTGAPYLWGGMSQKGIDCSGLTYVSYRGYGITIPRDADQQFLIGTPVEREDLQPGDMVFFGDHDGIVHVGLYAGKGQLLHASSSIGVTTSPLFTGWYEEHYRGARRIFSPDLAQPKTFKPAL